MGTFTFHRPFVILAQYVGTAILFFLSAKLALTAGSVVVFAWFLEKFFEPIQEISDQLLHIERALTSSERLFNLLDVQPKVVDKANAREIKHFHGKIEFKNVWFSYDNKNWVLKDVSFVVQPGQTFALVGATGAGKTTIFSLLTKAYTPQKGQILIDDIDINDIKVSSIRGAIGQMLQDVFLFSGTIKSNITLFDDKFNDEEIKAACDYVNASHFINKLENKYDEKVVERGENLSQGERQLLSFARTILHKPQIMLLDEATANIDTETEALIQDSLNKMSTLGTMLVVAHRLSTIQKADNIICLQNGEIIESGTHNELLKNKNYYWRLYKLQFK
jgi:ATP-binding cassette subfamily B protein